MKYYLQHIALLLLMLSVSTCVDPFDFGFDQDAEQNFVIEGYLTSIPGEHEIRVSRTTYIGEFNGVVADFVTNAKVAIVDDQGAEIPLTYDRTGIYVTGPNAVALPGRFYKVQVQLVNGRTYESSFEALSEDLAINNDIAFNLGSREVINENNFIFEEEGVKITANVQKSAVNKYYRWELDHYFIIESDQGPGLTFQEQEGLENEELRYCFVKDYPFQDVHLLRDIANEADVGQTYQIDLEFISIDNKFEYEFVVESKLLALPERDYTFWSNVQSLADNTGSLFDAAPFEVIGNIREITGSAEEVAGLGFFGVYNAKIDREFINPQDIGISDPNVFPVCEVPASPGPPRPHPCQDCRLYEYLRNYENNPPDWWQY